MKVKKIDLHAASKRLLVGLVAALLLATVIAAGLRYATAATPALKVTPFKGTIQRGTVFNVQIKAYSETQLNAIQANLTYTSSLEVIGISYEGSAFPVEAESTYNNGQIRIARASFTPVNGEQLVATISFKATADRSAAKLAFSGDSALVTATDNRNILGAVVNGNYKVR